MGGMPAHHPARSGIKRLAPAALVPAGAFAVHQLRYWLAFGRHAAAELQVQGHSYLHSVVPWIVLLLALSIGAFLLSLGRAFGGRSSRSRHTLSFATLWLLCSACLVAIYVSQEFLEGLFATGHPGGLIGIFGYGGWWSIPAAVAVGLVLTAAFHGARRVLEAVAARFGGRPEAAPRAIGSVRLPRDVLLAAPAPLAGGWSGRGPPG
jgi:vacuolar-type H+-ATPase subunit I/STV1